MMELSAHFTLDEMIYSKTAESRGIINIPSENIIRNLCDLCTVLEDVRDLLVDQPIIVSSGYRCQQLNAAVGGSKTSAHVNGLAVDFISPPLTPLEICQKIAASTIDFDQLIWEHDWVHLSISTTKNRRQVLTLTETGYAEGIVD